MENKEKQDIIKNEVFAPGNVVALKIDPTVKVAVIGVQLGEVEPRYTVLQNNSIRSYYASQLVPLQQEQKELLFLDLRTFQARLTALQLLHPSITELYSLHAARVNFIPYQFKPVLKLIRSDRPRLLIADEVGVGKTIEAGLILRELQARREVNSVLIFCPKALVTDHKWQRELKRFDEAFSELDGPTLRNCITETDLDGEWPIQFQKAIIPFSLLDEVLLQGTEANKRGKMGRISKKRKGLLDLEPPPRFDLIIVDEAHHLRNLDTQVHQTVRFFCEHAEAVIFLTATPIQLGQNDLFVLLNLLRPDLIIDEVSFEHLSEPNPLINRAIDLARKAKEGWREQARLALLEAGRTSGGQAFLQNNPAFKSSLNLLGLPNELSQPERLSFIRQVEELHTFSHIINRTRRRDIGKFTTRWPETIEIPFSPEQQHLHDFLLQTQARILLRTHEANQIKFLMTTIRRQAASCIHGLAPFLREILHRQLNIEIELEEDFGLDQLEVAELLEQSVNPIKDDIEKVFELAEKLTQNDPKLQAFLEILTQKKALANNKVLVFSAFRHTLRYLSKHLASQGLRFGLIQGITPDYERQLLRNRFSLAKEDPEAIDLLLSSEVGCEGLDYQFCDCLINYDIPWNPMRVEQRIGRIDRYGQQSEKIVIYNLITPGTVDFDIYERCLKRIQVFHEAIGGSEEILGEIARKIKDIAENLQLTSKERQTQLQQLADNEIRLIQEQNDLEDHQLELFGLTLPPDQMQAELQAFTSPWLTPNGLQNLTEFYLEALTKHSQNIQGNKERRQKNLRTSQETRATLLAHFQTIAGRKTSPIYREWDQWLKSGDANLTITFEAKTAAEDQSLMFITPIHPLVIQAANYLMQKVPPGEAEQPYTILKIKNTNIGLKPAIYPFAIYLWQKEGLRQDINLQPICSSPEVATRFMELVEKAQDVQAESEGGKALQTYLPGKEVFEVLEQQHYFQWEKANKLHQQNIAQQADFRRSSLQSSHKARLKLIEEQLNRAANEKIRRMRQAQLYNAETDYQKRLKEIEQAQSTATIIAQAVGWGVLIVE